MLSPVHVSSVQAVPSESVSVIVHVCVFTQPASLLHAATLHSGWQTWSVRIHGWHSGVHHDDVSQSPPSVWPSAFTGQLSELHSSLQWPSPADQIPHSHQSLPGCRSSHVSRSDTQE